MARRYRRRDAAEWQTIIERQQTSGQSQAAFCRAEGLALSTFTRWQRILERGARRSSAEAPRGAGAEPADTPMFAALTAPAETKRRGLESETGWEVEMELGRSVRLRIRRTVA